MHLGIRLCGDRPRTILETHYDGPHFDVAVFYGYTATLRRVMADYIAAGKPAVYIDLGYWGREGLTGYHKIVINGRHPTTYFQRIEHRGDRFRRHGVTIKPWRESGDHILLAGMGAKAAEAEGFEPEQFEKDAIRKLRGLTKRRIIYRPKPSWLQARPLGGTDYSPVDSPLDGVLRNCHAVVTHHSNVAVDAVLEGVPVFCTKGAATSQWAYDLRGIESPVLAGNREQWAADLAYTQWNVDEMKRGLPWAHLKDEGLIG